MPPQWWQLNGMLFSQKISHLYNASSQGPCRGRRKKGVKCGPRASSSLKKQRWPPFPQQNWKLRCPHPPPCPRSEAIFKPWCSPVWSAFKYCFCQFTPGFAMVQLWRLHWKVQTQSSLQQLLKSTLTSETSTVNGATDTDSLAGRPFIYFFVTQPHTHTHTLTITHPSSHPSPLTAPRLIIPYTTFKRVQYRWTSRLTVEWVGAPTAHFVFSFTLCLCWECACGYSLRCCMNATEAVSSAEAPAVCSVALWMTCWSKYAPVM